MWTKIYRKMLIAAAFLTVKNWKESTLPFMWKWLIKLLYKNGWLNSCINIVQNIVQLLKYLQHIFLYLRIYTYGVMLRREKCKIKPRLCTWTLCSCGCMWERERERGGEKFIHQNMQETYQNVSFHPPGRWDYDFNFLLYASLYFSYFLQ